MEDGLLAFAFDGQQQDIDRFRNEPFWGERFGDANGEQRFRWTFFYKAVAAKILDYRADRKPLIEGPMQSRKRWRGYQTSLRPHQEMRPYNSLG